MSKLWENFPVKDILAMVLKPGGAFRMLYSFGQEEPKLRYFFIINYSPQTSDILLLSTATTQISKRIKSRPVETLVYILPSEYGSLQEDSIIDCNSVTEINQNDFLNKISNKKIEPLSALPQDILIRIRKAVQSAKGLTPKQKHLILPSEEY